MGVEPFHLLQLKDLPLESIVLPDTNLNFRTPIAHKLAHGTYSSNSISTSLRVTFPVDDTSEIVPEIRNRVPS